MTENAVEVSLFDIPAHPTRDDAVEVSPFDFVDPGSGDKDFTAYIEQVEPEEENGQVQPVPKGPVPAPHSFSPEIGGESAPPVEAPHPPTDSSPTLSETTESPSETSAVVSSPLPATPPIPSSPSVAKTTPPAS